MHNKNSTIIILNEKIKKKSLKAHYKFHYYYKFHNYNKKCYFHNIFIKNIDGMLLLVLV